LVVLRPEINQQFGYLKTTGVGFGCGWDFERRIGREIGDDLARFSVA